MKTKKELKAAYKQKLPEAGVFQVLNKATGAVLIEGATNVTSKWNRHRTELRFGSHRNKQLQNDWKEHGESQFEFSILSALKIEEGQDVDLKEEIDLLYEMVMEEKIISANKFY